MIRGHKIRIYPSASQEELLRQYVGGARFVYNWALDNWKKWAEEKKQGLRDDSPNWIRLSKIWTQERPEWATGIPRCTVAAALKAVNVAFTNHFKKGTGWPKFKKKGCCKDSFYTDNVHAYIRKDGKHLHLPGIKTDIRMAEPIRFVGKVMAYSVSTYAGKWYVSVRVEIEDLRSAPDSTCGIDVGMKIPAVCSDNNTLILPEERLRRLAKKLKRAQAIYSRRKRDSKRRAKALLRKQRIQDKINNIRCDAIHKFTSKVCKSHATVIIEDLNCAGMHKGSSYIRPKMQSSCMSEVHRQLEYKAINLVKADRWFPSTQLCSKCGSLPPEKLKLTQRVYRCAHCGLEIDRDLNAAINLSKYPGSLG